MLSTIHLIERLNGGGGPLTVKVILGGNNVFNGYAEDVADLKNKIFETLGIYVHRQDFGLPDDFSRNTNNSLTLTLNIIPPRPTALGIGAGGSITQEIFEDKSNPRMWDVGSSKILYVHIVNSSDFKAITGLPLPETPVPWKMYSALRLPYDKEWGRSDIEGKGVSSDGVFDKLVSLEEEDGSGGGNSEGSRRESDSYDHHGSYNVPSYPLTLLDVDQTLPWFEGIGNEGKEFIVPGAQATQLDQC